MFVVSITTVPCPYEHRVFFLVSICCVPEGGRQAVALASNFKFPCSVPVRILPAVCEWANTSSIPAVPEGVSTSVLLAVFSVALSCCVQSGGHFKSSCSLSRRPWHSSRRVRCVPKFPCTVRGHHCWRMLSCGQSACENQRLSIDVQKRR